MADTARGPEEGRASRRARASNRYELRRRLLRRLGRALPERRSHWALVSVSSLDTLESSAALLAAVDAMESLGWPAPRVISEMGAIEWSRLERRVGEGLIVVLDRGGTGAHRPVGDILARGPSDAPRNPVVVLTTSPPTGRWAEDVALTVVSDLVEARDTHARPRADRRTVLCPDILFGLGPLEREPPASDETVKILSRDSLDLLRGLRNREVESDQLLRRLGRGRPAIRSATDRLREGLHLRAAAARLRAAVTRLSACSVVITDRWDVHVLCLLLGIRHVVVAEPESALATRVERWTEHFPTVRRSDDLDRSEAVAASFSAPCVGCGDAPRVDSGADPVPCEELAQIGPTHPTGGQVGGQHGHPDESDRRGHEDQEVEGGNTEE